MSSSPINNPYGPPDSFIRGLIPSEAYLNVKRVADNIDMVNNAGELVSDLQANVDTEIDSARDLYNLSAQANGTAKANADQAGVYAGQAAASASQAENYTKAITSIFDYGAVGDGVTNDRLAIQTAINDLAAKGGGTIDFGGAGYTFLVEGDPEYYGTLVVLGVTYPFPRGFISLASNVHFRGSGACIKVGTKDGSGNVFPLAPGIFYTDFWTADNVEYSNIWFDGLEFNCNASSQPKLDYPANPEQTTNVWQHGSAISITYGNNIKITRCKFHDIRGDSARIFQDNANNYSRNIEFAHNELYDIFTQGIGIGGSNIWIHHNYFHGDGYWVAGIDIEILGSQAQIMRDIIVESNFFDFSDGLGVAENVTLGSSLSSAAINGRVPIRRAISVGHYTWDSDGQTLNGNFARVVFKNNHVIDGTIDTNCATDIVFEGNLISNVTYYDTSNIIGLSSAIIAFTNFNSVVGMRRLVCRGNAINSALHFTGIGAIFIDELEIANNYVTTAGAGIVLNGSNAIVYGNTIRDCGRVLNDTEAADTFPNRFNAGVFSVGDAGKEIQISDNSFIETRESPLMPYAVSLASGGGVLVCDNSYQGTVFINTTDNITVYANIELVGNTPNASSWSSNVAIEALTFQGTGADQSVLAGSLKVNSGLTVDLSTGTRQVAFTKGLQILNTVYCADDGTIGINQFKSDGTINAQIVLFDSLGNTRLSQAMPVYADNASAISGGLAVGSIYRNSTGALSIVYSG